MLRLLLLVVVVTSLHKNTQHKQTNATQANKKIPLSNGLSRQNASVGAFLALFLVD
eukprot:m.121501 g.121501  ORF g.121501 m.121501 type:complete len:56 (-) comp23280_c0_seq5:503-670(-)